MLREIEDVYFLHNYTLIGGLRIFARNFKIKSCSNPNSRQSDSGKFRAHFGLKRNLDDTRKASVTQRNI